MMTLRGNLRPYLVVTDLQPSRRFMYGKDYPLADDVVSGSSQVQSAIRNRELLVVKESGAVDRPQELRRPGTDAPTPDRLDRIASAVGEIRALMFERVLPALSRRGSHNPFVDADGETLSQPEGADDVLSPQLEEVMATLRRIELKVDSLQGQALAVPTPHQDHPRDPTAPVYIPTDLVDRDALRGAKIDAKVEQVDSSGVDDASEALKALKRQK